jgi:hypothetical protein
MYGDQGQTAIVTHHGAGPSTAADDRPEYRRIRTWVLGFLGFAVIAVVGLMLPFGSLGLRVLLLVVAFQVGVVLLAQQTGDRILLRAWLVLAPLSVLMVLPDWFLSAEVGSLLFPDTGAPFIGTVPLFMAGMWTIALLPVVLIGIVVADRRGMMAGAAAAAVAGLLLFWAAEVAAPMIPLWEPIGASMVAGIAIYVIVPEVVLSAAAFVIVATVGRVPLPATVALTALLPFTYLGMLAASYQFLG